ncbi:MAG: protein phosphatase 2C domain-containing protein [Chloroflexota bacterium]|nr:protein phosphatase 2C domain-containing protein [Chloroflexota bacterium]
MSDLSAGAHTRSRAVPAARLIGVDAFQIQKRGNAQTECEDAYCYGDPTSKIFRAAVADGATEAIFSRRWAEMLVRHFVDRPRWGKWNTEWLAEPGAAFRSNIDISSLPWYAQEKAGRGAFATLLGISFNLRTGRYWARSVGDSCCVVVDHREVRKIFPPYLATSAAFGSNPYLLGSNPSMNQRLDQPQIQFGERGSRIPIGRSQFLLMTDAIACWFVAAIERHERPWLELDEIAQEDDFGSFVASKRDAGVIRNDDTTLVRITIQRMEKG